MIPFFTSEMGANVSAIYKNSHLSKTLTRKHSVYPTTNSLDDTSTRINTAASTVHPIDENVVTLESRVVAETPTTTVVDQGCMTDLVLVSDSVQDRNTRGNEDEFLSTSCYLEVILLD
jgi:hypothetical protein